MDAEGNTYVAVFNGTTRIGSTQLTAAGIPALPDDDLPAPADVFVAKLDAAGNYLWAVPVGGTLHDEVTSMAVDADGDLYLAGQFESHSIRFDAAGPQLFNSSARSEGYIAKVDGKTGKCLWAKQCGGKSDESSLQIALSAQNELFVCGNMRSDVADFGPFTLRGDFPGSAFLAKLTADGTWQWAQSLGTGYPRVSSLLLDQASNLYVSGYFNSPTLRFGATTLATKRPFNSSSLTGSDIFVTKLNSAGAYIWAVQGDANGLNITLGLSMTYDGVAGLYVSGSYYSQSMRLGSMVLPNRSGVVPNQKEGFPDEVNYYSDVFVARLDTARGEWRWATRAGGAQGDYIGPVLADEEGRVYVAGSAFSGLCQSPARWWHRAAGPTERRDGHMALDLAAGTHCGAAASLR